MSAIPLSETAMPESDIAAVLETLRSGWLTMGPRIQQLEQTLQEAFEAPHAVTVSSGTAALQLALLGVGVGPGDEVILSALSFAGAAAAVRASGAEPVLCDVRGAHDPTLDPQDVAARITPRTKAVVAVHLLGYPADVAALRPLCDAHDVALVEDAAHAIGARHADGAPVGTAGDAGCFSLSAGKQLGVGEGGFVTTASEAVAARVRSLRSHAMTSVTWDRHRGHANTYDIVDIGFNFRLDEPRAALALARLPRLAEEIERRRALVRAYRAQLADVPGVQIPWDDEAVARSSHHRFAIVLPDAATRDRLRERLAAEGIETGWSPAISTLTAYRALGPRPRAEDVAARHLALPLAPSFEVAQVDAVAAAVRRALA